MKCLKQKKQRKDQPTHFVHVHGLFQKLSCWRASGSIDDVETLCPSSERCHFDRVVFSTLMRTATNIIRKLSIIYHDIIVYIIRRRNTSKCKSGLLQIEVATATKKKLLD